MFHDMKSFQDIFINELNKLGVNFNSGIKVKINDRVETLGFLTSINGALLAHYDLIQNKEEFKIRRMCQRNYVVFDEGLYDIFKKQIPENFGIWECRYEIWKSINGQELKAGKIHHIREAKLSKKKGDLGCFRLKKLPYYIDILEEEPEKNEDNLIEIDVKDLIIRTTKHRCIIHDHRLDRIRAIVKVVTLKGEIKNVEAEAMYCSDCDEYYMTENEYERVRCYGSLGHKVITEIEYVKGGKNHESWAAKSTLCCYGYNVNEQENLSDIERQVVLDFIIQNRIMSKDEILSFLEWLVNNRGHRFSNAKEKWQRDINYIRSKSNIAKSVEVGSIYIKEYIKIK